MNSLLPDHSTEAERAIEQATARLGNVDVPITRLWNPATCPAAILPWLAWAFSVDQWDATWTVEQKRAVVAASIAVHKRKGTPGAVKAAVGAIFTGANVVEPWDDASLTAHQFKIVTTDTLESDADFDELIRLVDAAKPVRSWLVAVQIQREITDTVYVGTATRSGGKTTLRGRLAIDPDALDLFYGVATRYATRTTIDAQDPSFAVNGFEPEFVASFAKSSPDVKRWNYYRANGVEVDFSKAFDFARTSGATYVDATGTIQTAAAGVPRVGHHVWDGSAWVNEGLLLESEARTNSLPYSTLGGAAVGVVGSGGSLPAGWFVTNMPAGTVEVVSLADKDGRPNIRIRLNGTPTGAAAGIFFNGSTSIVAATGQTWTGSAWVQRAAGDLTNITTVRIQLDERTATGSFIGATTVNFEGDIDSDTRRVATRTLTGAAAERVSTSVQVINTLAPIDITLDISATQLELGPTPSSYIPTSGATAARAAETNSTDNATYDASAMWGVMKGTEIYADLGTAGQVKLLDWRDDADNRITITLDTDGAETGEITLTMVNGGVSASVAVDAMTPGINRAFSLAWRVTGSEIAISCNGGAAVSAATAIGIPDLSAASIVLEGMGARALITQGTGDIGDTGIESASA